MSDVKIRAFDAPHVAFEGVKHRGTNPAHYDLDKQMLDNMSYRSHINRSKNDDRQKLDQPHQGFSRC